MVFSTVVDIIGCMGSGTGVSSAVVFAASWPDSTGNVSLEGLRVAVWAVMEVTEELGLVGCWSAMLGEVSDIGEERCFK